MFKIFKTKDREIVVNTDKIAKIEIREYPDSKKYLELTFSNRLTTSLAISEPAPADLLEQIAAAFEDERIARLPNGDYQGARQRNSNLKG